MDALEQDFAAGLFDACAPPCISLYQPTHRHHPANAQDPIRFRNLLRELQQSLRQKYAGVETESWLAPLAGLAEDREFWNHSRDGLAVLAAPNLFRAYRLQRAVPEIAVVAETFHIKPLLRILQSADRYQILALTRDSVRLFEGNRDALDEIEPAAEVPRKLVDALGTELTEPKLRVSSYGGTQGPAMRHGQGGRKDELDLDAERYFRAVDRAVHEQHSQASGLPLLLAALPDNQSTFRRVSRNPALLEQGIAIDPEALGLDALRKEAWRVIEPRYLARLAELVDRFKEQKAKGLATESLGEAAAAAVTGRVGALLLEAGRHVPGRIDPATGKLRLDDWAKPDVDDALDDLGELVMQRGGEVIIVPRERMPTASGIAASYRY
jgi:hypothetical protein